MALVAFSFLLSLKLLARLHIVIHGLTLHGTVEVNILSEELVARPGGWNYDQKRWDQILPPVGEYLDSCNEGLYWIPYLGAAGTDLWESLGITYSWLQPNYYWDTSGSKPLAKTMDRIRQFGMGIELEFEYSMVEEVMKIPGIKGPDAQGNYSFTLSDVPSCIWNFVVSLVIIL